MLTPTGLPSHLASLDAKWDELLEQLKTADEWRREALRIYQRAYATAYIQANYTPSNDAMRKQTAILETVNAAAVLERWESEVRFVRDELRALGSRTDIARSLFSGVKAAAS